MIVSNHCKCHSNARIIEWLSNHNAFLATIFITIEKYICSLSYTVKLLQSYLSHRLYLRIFTSVCVHSVFDCFICALFAIQPNRFVWCALWAQIMIYNSVASPRCWFCINFFLTSSLHCIEIMGKNNINFFCHLMTGYENVKKNRHVSLSDHQNSEFSMQNLMK